MAASKKKAVATINNGDLPDYLKGKDKSVSFGNTDSSDFIVPRMKLLQGISPELQQFEQARSGEFWHTILNESFGAEMSVVPVRCQKTYALWAPRNDERGMLALASDAIHWDIPDLEFEVKHKNVKSPVKYSLGKTVEESGLAKFGSMIPDDPTSPPAAALTYQMLFVDPNRMEIGPFIVFNTRSSVKPGKELISKIDLRAVDHFAQRYTMRAVAAKNKDGQEFCNYQYVADGYVDEDVFAVTQQLYERFKDMAYRASDETEEDASTGPTDSKKF